MSTYKVLQDIESEDHLVGPLSLRQCIYAAIAILGFYLSFLATTKHAAFLDAIFLPPALFCLMFAIPWQTHQTTEIWVLAKIRFFFKPRRRIWDQSGVRELVTVTVPKKVEINYTNGLSEDEVHSRLEALANTIDSRGWAIKNVTADVYAKPQFLTGNASSDRLVGIETFSKPVSDDPSYDVLDETSNPIAQQFDTMINASRQAQRQQIQQEMAEAAALPVTTVPTPVAAPPAPAANDYWFLNPTLVNAMPTATVAPGSLETAVPTPTADEEALAEQLRTQAEAQNQAYSHMHTLGSNVVINPSGTVPVPPAQPVSLPVTPPIDPAILNLANNNDLNVATIARQANEHLQDTSGEVVINLH
jgi:hypothetical protein